MFKKKTFVFYVSTITTIPLILVMYYLLQHAPVPLSSAPPGTFTLDDLSFVEMKTGKRLFIDMTKDEIQLFGNAVENARAQKFEYRYYNSSNHNRVGHITILPKGKNYATARGIRIEDNKNKVIERYGPVTFSTEKLSGYAFIKNGEEITLLPDSEAIANVTNESSIHTLLFHWTIEENPKVYKITVENYADGNKDPKAEGKKRVRESVTNIPETGEGVVALYNKYLEQAITGHIQFENYQIGYTRYRELDELSLQMIRNLANGLMAKGDSLYPAGFKQNWIDFMEEGYQLIDHRSKNKRNADKEINHGITVNLKKYRDRMVDLAGKFGYSISSDSLINIQAQTK